MYNTIREESDQSYIIASSLSQSEDYGCQQKNKQIKCLVRGSLPAQPVTESDKLCRLAVAADSIFETSNDYDSNHRNVTESLFHIRNASSFVCLNTKTFVISGLFT